jgi:hypothetical protein
MALALVAVFVLAAIWVLQARRGGGDEPTAGAAVKFLLVFAAVSYVLWEAVFSILRYAVVLEVLGGTLIVAATAAVVARFTARPVVAVVAAGVLLAGAVAGSVPLNWGRVPFGPRVFSVEVPPVPSDSLVVLLGPTLSYVLPFIDAPHLQAVATGFTTTPGTYLFTETSRRISDHPGPLFVLMSAEATQPSDLDRARQFGLEWDERDCQPIVSNMTAVQSICAARRT